MFSQTAEYALRVVAFLAAAGGEAVTTKQISEGTRVPVGYLAKVLQSLSRGGIVRSQRGPHGGSVLARPAEELTIYDVIQAVDPIRRITSCPLGLKSHGSVLCPVHRRLDNALGLVERSFRDATIADLLTEPSRSKPLCDMDGAGKSAPVPLTLPRGRRAAQR
jgi:Rrf2 family transcriptional regulator, nitric oxide-sensitive transcriptional repressor